MGELPEHVDGLPNLCGSEPRIQAAIAAGYRRPVFLGRSSVDIAGIDSAFAVALHMHQPLIPAGGLDLRTAANAAFFTEGEEPLGSPGGAANVGPLVRDVAFVADYQVPDS